MGKLSKIIPDKGGRYNKGSIYVVKHINYFLVVNGKLYEGLLG